MNEKQRRCREPIIDQKYQIKKTQKELNITVKIINNKIYEIHRGTIYICDICLGIFTSKLLNYDSVLVSRKDRF